MNSLEESIIDVTSTWIEYRKNASLRSTENLFRSWSKSDVVAIACPVALHAESKPVNGDALIPNALKKIYQTGKRPKSSRNFVSLIC